MKSLVLDSIDKKLEQIIENLTEAGQRNAGAGYESKSVTGDLPPPEFESLKLAQEVLGLLRQYRTRRRNAGK